MEQVSSKLSKSFKNLRSLEEEIFRLDVRVNDVCLLKNLCDPQHLDREVQRDWLNLVGFQRGYLKIKNKCF